MENGSRRMGLSRRSGATACFRFWVVLSVIILAAQAYDENHQIIPAEKVFPSIWQEDVQRLDLSSWRSRSNDSGFHSSPRSNQEINLSMCHEKNIPVELRDALDSFGPRFAFAEFVQYQQSKQQDDTDAELGWEQNEADCEGQSQEWIKKENRHHHHHHQQQRLTLRDDEYMTTTPHALLEPLTFDFAVVAPATLVSQQQNRDTPPVPYQEAWIVSRTTDAMSFLESNRDSAKRWYVRVFRLSKQDANLDGMSGGGSGFCTGMPMTMSLTGFQSSLFSKSSCLAYLFSAWRLSSLSQFRGTMFFTFLLALLTEGLSVVRRAIVRNTKHGTRRRVLLTLLYTLQQFMGYLIMFVAMMYSIELLLSVVAGLAIGNLLFVRLDYSRPPMVLPLPMADGGLDVVAPLLQDSRETSNRRRSVAQ